MTKIQPHKIETTDQEGRIWIALPYDLKNVFRTVFPSARWDPDAKKWSVSRVQRKKVDEWVKQIEESGILDELNAFEEDRLVDAEIKRLESQIQIVKSEIETMRLAADIATGDRDHRYAILEQLRTEDHEVSRQLNQAAEAAQAAQAESQAAGDDLLVEVGKIIDLDGLRADLDSLRRVAGVPKAYAREQRDAIAERLMAQFRTVRSAGLRMSGLYDELLGENFNRIKRDDVDRAIGALAKIDLVTPPDPVPDADEPSGPSL